MHTLMTMLLENEVCANRSVHPPPGSPKTLAPLRTRYAPLRNPNPTVSDPKILHSLWLIYVSAPAPRVLRQLAQGYASLRKPKQHMPPGPFLIFPCAHGPTRLDTLLISTRISIQAVPTNPKYSQANPNLMHLALTRPATFHALLPSASPHLSDLFRPNPTIKFSHFFTHDAANADSRKLDAGAKNLRRVPVIAENERAIDSDMMPAQICQRLFKTAPLLRQKTAAGNSCEGARPNRHGRRPIAGCEMLQRAEAAGHQQRCPASGHHTARRVTGLVAGHQLGIDLRVAYLGSGNRILEWQASEDLRTLTEVVGEINHFSRYAVAY